jgi:DNA-binding NtrC family response regulator
VWHRKNDFATAPQYCVAAFFQEMRTTELRQRECLQAIVIDEFTSADIFMATSLRPTILIVDDESEVADTCARVLKRAGFDCLVAYDSPSAVALFDSRQPALVLSDIYLGNGDGFEIARYVHSKSPLTPVILMTAHHAENLAQQAACAGAARYLRKPFSNAELLSTVKFLLTRGPEKSGGC